MEEAPPRMKTCSKCHTEKDLEKDFPKNRTTKDGKDYWCRECRNAIKKNKRDSSRGKSAKGGLRTVSTSAAPHPVIGTDKPGQAVMEFIFRNRLSYVQGAVIRRICRYDTAAGNGIQDLEEIIRDVRMLIDITQKGDDNGKA